MSCADGREWGPLLPNGEDVCLARGCGRASVRVCARGKAGRCHALCAGRTGRPRAGVRACAWGAAAAAARWREGGRARRAGSDSWQSCGPARAAARGRPVSPPGRRARPQAGACQHCARPRWLCPPAPRRRRPSRLPPPGCAHRGGGARVSATGSLQSREARAGRSRRAPRWPATAAASALPPAPSSRNDAVLPVPAAELHHSRPRRRLGLQRRLQLPQARHRLAAHLQGCRLAHARGKTALQIMPTCHWALAVRGARTPSARPASPCHGGRCPRRCAGRAACRCRAGRAPGGLLL